MSIRETIEAQGGVAAVLGSMVSTLREMARDYPMWSLPEEQIGAGVGQAQVLRQVAQALSAVLVREADERGLATVDGLSMPDWVQAQVARAAGGQTPDQTPDETAGEPGASGASGGVGALPVTFDGGQAATLTTVAAAMRVPRWAELAQQVASCRLAPEQAAVIVRFEQDLARVADPQHLAGVVDSLVEHAPVFTMRELRRLVSHGRASLRPPAEVDAVDRAHRMGRSLRKVGGSAGMTEYALRLDPEGAAVLDAAIDPLARPRPDLDWSGVACEDPRAADTRRADALLEIIGRGVGAPEGVTRTPRAKLVVTISHEALTGQVRGAGLVDNDEVLSPGTVRRIACEAGIVPMVLGARSQVLDLGDGERFFTPAQRRALGHRDKGCTFPGCTIPPQWCEAHHVVHWADGGLTDLANGTLLCGRHHTVVHQRGMTATVTDTSITWHQ